MLGSGVLRTIPGTHQPRRWPVWLVWVLGVAWLASLLQSLATGDEVMAEGAGPAYRRTRRS